MRREVIEGREAEVRQIGLAFAKDINRRTLSCLSCGHHLFRILEASFQDARGGRQRYYECTSCCTLHAGDVVTAA